MTSMEFEPGKILGDRILDLSRKELCLLVSTLCRQVMAEAGSRGYRGGIYPENISLAEDGAVSIGLSRQRDWDGQELEFLAPELYWNGQRGPAADVYSLGMLLFYGVSKGRLPYEGECENPQLRRMGGEDFKAPKAAGRRLGEIIEKATRFKAADRYQSVEEMQIMLDSCVKNLYLSGVTSAEAIFNKSDDDLSEIERLMVGIIEREEEEPIPEDEPVPEPVAEPEAPEALEEPSPVEEPAPIEEPAIEEPAPAAEPIPAQPPVPEEDIIAKTFSSKTDEAEAPAPAEKDSKPADSQEDIQIYKPVKTKKPVTAHPTSNKPPVPVLKVEKNPELEPVIPRSAPVTPAVQYGKSAERERNIAKQMKKKRGRPVLVILVLCVLLVVTAIIINAMLKDFAWNDSPDNSQPSDNPAQTSQPTEPGGAVGIVITPEPAQTTEPDTQPAQSTYQVFIEDVSWTQAQARCAQLGGHLAVISDVEEFGIVVQHLEAAGLNRAWIGCHRVDGVLTWETGEQIGFYPWDSNEPSYEDSYDGVIEDYLLLWNNNGWVYNDSRNDPVSDYPQWYAGMIGFVCEFEG